MKKITVLVLLILSMIAGSLQVNASSTGITGPDVIHKQYNHILTIGNILSLYSSELGQIQVIEDNYTGYGNVIGTKTITLSASSGTTQATKIVEIVIVNELGNVTAVTDYKNIHLKDTQILTPSEIVYVLERTGYIDITSTTQMMILTNTYTGNSSQQGQYLFEFRLVNSAGVDQVYSSIISVSVDANLFVPDIIFEAPPSAFSKLWSLLESLFYLALIIGVGYGVYKLVTKPRKKV
jgi:hypothetical protein